MEFQQILQIIKDKKTSILGIGIACAFIGSLVFWLVPTKYVAYQTLFITRTLQDPTLITDDNFSEFTYEGYYAQQNAALFSSSLAEMIEGKTVHSLLLKEQGEEVTESSLRSLSRNLRVKNNAPQILEVSLKSRNPENLKHDISTLTGIITNLNTNINKKGDNSLQIIQVGEPVIVRTYANVYLNFVVGFAIGLLLSTLYQIFRLYSFK